MSDVSTFFFYALNLHRMIKYQKSCLKIIIVKDKFHKILLNLQI